MHICYIDESGTSDIPGNTSHFVLAGFAVPLREWRTLDRSITVIMQQYGLGEEELHTGWILRNYGEQKVVPGFDQLGWTARRAAVQKIRNNKLLQLQKSGPSHKYRQTKKNFEHTKAYIHLTMDEREGLVLKIADMVSGWQRVRLFAECIDKTYFDPSISRLSVDEQALEQVVSRFEQFLVNRSTDRVQHYGLLVHDNNKTIERKHTALMRQFHKEGTFWTKIYRISETPLFVNSSLTRMVQIADLCGYALRRYLENNETDLFEKVFTRADRIENTVVGIRHFTNNGCACTICQSHKAKSEYPSSAAAALIPPEEDTL